MKNRVSIYGIPSVFLTLLVIATLAGCSQRVLVIDAEKERPMDLMLAGDSAYYAYDYSRIIGSSLRDSISIYKKQHLSVEQEPYPTREVKPQCPEEARITGPMSGKTIVRLLIDNSGNPVLAKILESSSSVFNDCSLIAAMQWKFHPALLHGQPVPVEVVIPFRFILCR
jgi:TonB family protein